MGAQTFTTIPGGPPGTGPAWVLSSGAMMLVQQITVTDAAGTVLFEKVYGNKAGLGSTINCFASLPGGLELEAELVTVP